MHYELHPNRGTSVIVAVILAAVLGVAALTLNVFQSGSTNTAALPAQVSATQQSLRKPPTPQQMQALCMQAKESAYNKTQSPPAEGTYPLAEVNQLKYNCVGAILMPGKQPSTNPSDYQCVGEQAKITENSQENKIVVSTSPMSGIPAGTCSKTQICTAAGCQDAKLPSSMQVGPNWCGNGATNPPTCTTCPGNTTLQNSVCQTSSPGAPPPPVSPPPPASPPDQTASGQTQYCLTNLEPLFWQTVPAGQTPPANNYGCSTTPPSSGAPQSGQQTPAPTQQASQNPATSGSNPLKSLLNGLTQGLTSAAPASPAPTSAVCTQPPVQPQCATGATAVPISAGGNSCITGYQCVPSGSTFTGQTPTPQISCSPQIADVGMPVAISYSCTNATGSSGLGFSTNNQTSGSATVTITTPPSGTNTATYGLTCTNGQSASTQCSVQINQPSITLVANPKSVSSGQTSAIGWVTAGMQSCTISSPQNSTFTSANANNQSVNGVAQTDAITSDTEFVLTCSTLGGQTQTAATTVSVGNGAGATQDITATSTADGQTVDHGDTVTISWNTPNPASNSAMSLWLIDVQSENATALIAGGEPTSGSYQWQIPNTGAVCDPDSPAPCATDLVAGDSYGIEAALYDPKDAFLGGSPVPSGAISPMYTDYGYTQTPFTIGQ